MTIRIENDNVTGELLAMYLQVRKGKVAEVREELEGVAYADYDRKGNLLGVELLGGSNVAITVNGKAVTL